MQVKCKSEHLFVFAVFRYFSRFQKIFSAKGKGHRITGSPLHQCSVLPDSVRLKISCTMSFSAHTGQEFFPPSQFSMVRFGISNSSLRRCCVHPATFRASLMVIYFPLFFVIKAITSFTRPNAISKIPRTSKKRISHLTMFFQRRRIKVQGEL